MTEAIESVRPVMLPDDRAITGEAVVGVLVAPTPKAKIALHHTKKAPSTVKKGTPRVPRRFTVSGPYEVPVAVVGAESRKPDADRCRQMWASELSDLRSEKGCYIFALRRGPGYLPVYVGKTTRTFSHECFQPQKLLYLRDALDEQHGTLVLFLVTYERTRGHTNNAAIGDLERYLIAQAATRNHDLKNVQLAKGPSFAVVGLTVPAKGKPSKSAVAIRQMLGVPAPKA